MKTSKSYHVTVVGTNAKVNQIGDRVNVTYWKPSKTLSYPVMETIELEGCRYKDNVNLVCLDPKNVKHSGHNAELVK